MLILEPLDGLLHLFGIAAAHAAGNLHNRVIIHAVFRVDILQDVHDHVGMLVIHGIDKRFPLFLRIFRVDVFGDLGQHGLIKGTGDDLLVELLHIEIQFIVQQFAVGDLSRHRIENSNRVADFIMNSFLA